MEGFTCGTKNGVEMICAFQMADCNCWSKWTETLSQLQMTGQALSFDDEVDELQKMVEKLAGYLTKGGQYQWWMSWLDSLKKSQCDRFNGILPELLVYDLDLGFMGKCTSIN